MLLWWTRRWYWCFHFSSVSGVISGSVRRRIVCRKLGGGQRRSGSENESKATSDTHEAPNRCRSILQIYLDTN